jgi:hypothetical protein
MKPCSARLAAVVCLIGAAAIGSTQTASVAGTRDQQGGAPLWLETQNVRTDSNGHYSLMLGSATVEGLPADVFSSGDARWLGVQPAGQPEQTRVMLLSVPYALKAGDAQTLGGLPASAFMLSVPSGHTSAPAAASSSSPPPPAPGPADATMSRRWKEFAAAGFRRVAIQSHHVQSCTAEVLGFAPAFFEPLIIVRLDFESRNATEPRRISRFVSRFCPARPDQIDRAFLSLSRATRRQDSLHTIAVNFASFPGAPNPIALAPPPGVQICPPERCGIRQFRRACKNPEIQLQSPEPRKSDSLVALIPIPQLFCR